ncbi:MAG: hypothetical protein JWQ09_3250 [Segetibacter sp.]|nr:hypothetical protein [Segetibacter sp.]
MKFTSEDVSTLIEELKGHDDVIGHCSQYWVGNFCVCNEDIYHEDR